MCDTLIYEWWLKNLRLQVMWHTLNPVTDVDTVNTTDTNVIDSINRKMFCK